MLMFLPFVTSHTGTVTYSMFTFFNARIYQKCSWTFSVFLEHFLKSAWSEGKLNQFNVFVYVLDIHAQI